MPWKNSRIPDGPRPNFGGTWHSCPACSSCHGLSELGVKEHLPRNTLMPPNHRVRQAAGGSLKAAKQQALELDRLNEALPGLSIGSYAAADSPELLEVAGITHAVCLCDDFPEPAQGLSSLHLPMSDSGSSNLEELARQAHAFIREGMKSGGQVLVFCGLGVNRSPALVTAYLVLQGWSLDAALGAVYKARPMTSLHQDYLAQLRTLAQRSTSKP